MLSYIIAAGAQQAFCMEKYFPAGVLLTIRNLYIIPSA